jgi:hypothetical protein
MVRALLISRSKTICTGVFKRMPPPAAASSRTIGKIQSPSLLPHFPSTHGLMGKDGVVWERTPKVRPRRELEGGEEEALGALPSLPTRMSSASARPSRCRRPRERGRREEPTGRPWRRWPGSWWRRIRRCWSLSERRGCWRGWRLATVLEKKGSRQRDQGRRVGGRGGPASPPRPLLYRPPCQPWRPPHLSFAVEQHEEAPAGRLRRGGGARARVGGD